MKMKKQSLLLVGVLMLLALALTLSSCGWISGLVREKPEGIADWDALEKNPKLAEIEFDKLNQPDQVFAARAGLTGQDLIDYMNSPEYEQYLEALNAAEGNGAAYDPEKLSGGTETGAFRFNESAAEITGVVVDPQIIEMNEKIREENGEDWDDPNNHPSANPSGNQGSLPERYKKLIPASMLADATVTPLENSYLIVGEAGKSDCQALVSAIKNAGYETLQEREIAGGFAYSACGKNDDMITVSFADGVFSIVITQ